MADGTTTWSSEAARTSAPPATRLLLQAAFAVFTITVVIGILNGIDAVDFGRNTLLTHVHAGTLGWITLGVVGGVDLGVPGRRRPRPGRGHRGAAGDRDGRGGRALRRRVLDRQRPAAPRRGNPRARGDRVGRGVAVAAPGRGGDRHRPPRPHAGDRVAADRRRLRHPAGDGGDGPGGLGALPARRGPPPDHGDRLPDHGRPGDRRVAAPGGVRRRVPVGADGTLAGRARLHRRRRPAARAGVRLPAAADPQPATGARGRGAVPGSPAAPPAAAWTGGPRPAGAPPAPASCSC